MPVPRTVASGLRRLPTALLALTALAACAQPASRTGTLARVPVPTPTLSTAPSATTAPSVPARTTPKPIRTTSSPGPTARPPVRDARADPGPSRRLLGDLQIHLVGRDCGFYVDSGGGLGLNYGKATAGGPVHNTNAFTWAIGGEAAAGNSWLGHTVKITVTVDPGNDVPETNEGNNVTVIAVNVPTVVPPAAFTNSDNTILCLTA